LFSNPPQAMQPSTNLAVFEIAAVLAGNVFSMAVGILALVFYNDTVVKDYFARLNGTLQSKPVTPSTPASLPDPTPATVEEPVAAPETQEPDAQPTEETPEPEEKPAKPKRVPRKVAKK